MVILVTSFGLLALRQRSPASDVGTLDVVWSTSGAEHPFSSPGALALGSNGWLYVLDRGHDSVQKLDSFTSNYLASWGGTGAADGEFGFCAAEGCRPGGSLAVDREGRVWVIDSQDRVQYFDDVGHRLGGWGQQGASEGELHGVGSIAFDSVGNLVITDGARVQRFTTAGRYLGQIGTAQQYKEPGSLAIDSHDNVYVGDWTANQILKYDSHGQLQWTLPTTAITGEIALVADRNDDLWVLESPGKYLKKFDPEGHLVREWNLGGFDNTWGLAVDASGVAFVTDIPAGSPRGRLSRIVLH